VPIDSCHQDVVEPTKSDDDEAGVGPDFGIVEYIEPRKGSELFGNVEEGTQQLFRLPASLQGLHFYSPDGFPPDVSHRTVP